MNRYFRCLVLLLSIVLASCGGAQQPQASNSDGGIAKSSPTAAQPTSISKVTQIVSTPIGKVSPTPKIIPTPTNPVPVNPVLAIVAKGRLAFLWSEKMNDEHEVCSDFAIMNANGSNLAYLTQNQAICSPGQIEWSPDGNKIVFVTQRSGARHISVLNVDGTGLIQIQGTVGYEPVWRPDGQQIAFRCQPESQPQICIVNADGTNLTVATDFPEGQEPAGRSTHQISWSPDGNQIAFRSGWNIFVMKADGSELTQITDISVNNLIIAASPAWSPDGMQIAFSMKGNIFVTNADGTRQAQITDIQTINGDIDQKAVWRPVWSPDGERIAFQGGDGVFAINVDGLKLIDLADIAISSQDEVKWSPDLTKIAIVGFGDEVIQIVSADGSGKIVEVSGSSPTWSPDSTQIAFRSPDGSDIGDGIAIMSADGMGKALVLPSENDVPSNDAMKYGYYIGWRP